MKLLVLFIAYNTDTRITHRQTFILNIYKACSEDVAGKRKSFHEVIFNNNKRFYACLNIVKVHTDFQFAVPVINIPSPPALRFRCDSHNNVHNSRFAVRPENKCANMRHGRAWSHHLLPEYFCWLTNLWRTSSDESILNDDHY